MRHEDKWAICFRFQKSRAGAGWPPPRFASMKRKALSGLSGQGEGIGAIPVQFSAVSHLSCLPRRLGCPWRRLGRSCPSCRATMFRNALIGPSCRQTGPSALTSELPNLNALGLDLRNASGVGVSRWTNVHSPILATGPPDLALALDIGLQNRSLKHRPICHKMQFRRITATCSASHMQDRVCTPMMFL